MEFASGNIFIRPHNLDKGDRIDGHQHRFDHTSVVFQGRVHIRARYVNRLFACDGCGRRWETRHTTAERCEVCGAFNPTLVSEREELLAARDLQAAQHVLIKADVEHEITALEDRTIFWCIYSHRDAQGRIVQAWDGWADAYR